jgi:hypothetical protein
MDKGLDYLYILDSDVFDLIALLGSFNRKNELESARQWYVQEVRKLMDSTKTNNMSGSNGGTIEMKPVNQDVVLDDLIANRFEN